MRLSRTVPLGSLSMLGLAMAAVAAMDASAATAGHTITDPGSLGDGALGHGIDANGEVAGASYTR